jgi:hypothetical protein
MITCLRNQQLNLFVLMLTLAGCGSDEPVTSKELIDVTPANAHNIVEQTGAKVDGMLKQNKQDMDAAIDAQSGGQPAQ